MAKRQFYWAGFEGGKLVIWPDTGFGGYGGGTLAIFTSRKAARREYQDVRKIRIVEVDPHDH